MGSCHGFCNQNQSTTDVSTRASRSIKDHELRDEEKHFKQEERAITQTTLDSLEEWQAPLLGDSLQRAMSFHKNTPGNDDDIFIDTNEIPWISSKHCFQCGLNTVHKCGDSGKKIENFANINRRWVSADVSRSFYARVRYIVQYPTNTPPLPHHDHPGGEEYLLMAGFFSDSKFGHVEAPAFVRYPRYSEHQAMMEASPVPSQQFCWWGMVETEYPEFEPSHWKLNVKDMTPDFEPTATDKDGNRRWDVTPEGKETRFEQWVAGHRAVVECEAIRAMELLVLAGSVAYGKTVIAKGCWYSFKNRIKRREWSCKQTSAQVVP